MKTELQRHMSPVVGVIMVYIPDSMNEYTRRTNVPVTANTVEACYIWGILRTLRRAVSRAEGREQWRVSFSVGSDRRNAGRYSKGIEE
jgi:hypothetical protein